MIGTALSRVPTAGIATIPKMQANMGSEDEAMPPIPYSKELELDLKQNCLPPSLSSLAFRPKCGSFNLAAITMIAKRPLAPMTTVFLHSVEPLPIK